MKKIYFLVALVLGAAFTINTTSASAQSAGEQKFSILNSAKKMAVYPLPATYLVNIQLSAALRQETEKLEIVNLTGRKVLEQRVLDKNVSEISFNNLRDLPAGIYMVVARDSNGQLLQSAKMIVTK